MLLLVSNVHEKGITESQDKRNLTTLHSCYIKNALVLSQSDARDLLTSIIGLAFPRVIVSRN